MEQLKSWNTKAYNKIKKYRSSLDEYNDEIVTLDDDFFTIDGHSFKGTGIAKMFESISDMRNDLAKNVKMNKEIIDECLDNLNIKSLNNKKCYDVFWDLLNDLDWPVGGMGYERYKPNGFFKKHTPQTYFASKYGRYKLTQPEKYIGNPYDVVYRSKGELAAFKFCDHTPTVKQWASEERAIPFQNKEYTPDLFIHTSQKIFIVEIKNQNDIKKPINKNAKHYEKRMQAWEMNSIKWNAARRYADRMGWIFVVCSGEKIGDFIDEDGAHAN